MALDGLFPKHRMSFLSWVSFTPSFQTAMTFLGTASLVFTFVLMVYHFVYNFAAPFLGVWPMHLVIVIMHLMVMELGYLYVVLPHFSFS